MAENVSWAAVSAERTGKNGGKVARITVVLTDSSA